MNYMSLRNPSDQSVSNYLGSGWKLHSVSVILDNTLIYHLVKVVF
jgi:hypothetical protein